MTRVDVHQHLWSEPLVHALEKRRGLPFIRRECGLTVLHLAGERPYAIDLSNETVARRAALVRHDGLDHALLCLSSPLGIEWLAHEQSVSLIDAYHDGALSLGEPFGVWGAIALDRADAADVDRALDRGCVGLSLPAGALSGLNALSRLASVLARLESRGAPLFVHPGPGRPNPRAQAVGPEASRVDPVWWPALTRYVSEMHAAWLTFLIAGRARHPQLRVVFSMLAGLAPLHCDRLASRGGPPLRFPDPDLFYETSSYGPATLRMVTDVVGAQQLLYGSDRPVLEPRDFAMSRVFDWDRVSDPTRRALGSAERVTTR